ncbi:MAG: maleylpyruvate isomerase N-terminal domain-containing protein, partial [Acidimicrobiia bacterium]
ARGPGQVRRGWDRARRHVEARLAETDSGMLIEVFGSTMAVDDYLVTRLVELIVHGDDLAFGLGAPTPAFSSDAFAAVLECLWEMARRRAKPMDLVRAMTRVERDQMQALRVL